MEKQLGETALDVKPMHPGDNGLMGPAVFRLHYYSVLRSIAFASPAGRASRCISS